jgi:hypothetical protein
VFKAKVNFDPRDVLCGTCNEHRTFNMFYHGGFGGGRSIFPPHLTDLPVVLRELRV